MGTQSPPPAGPMFGSTPGPDARTMKAQRRAQAQADRLRREQYRLQNRLQMRAARRSSIVGPALLIAIGIVLLLLESGRLHWSGVLTWLGRWWPAILILAGTLMTLEWALDRKQVSANGAATPSRRFLGGGAVALLILLAMLGAGAMFVNNSSVWMQHRLDEPFRESGLGDWSKMFGVHQDVTADLQHPLLAKGTLVIEDPRGDITVTGSSADGKVHVTVHQHIFAWGSEDVENRKRTERIAFSGDDGRLVLTAPNSGEDNADLSIEVPHDAGLVIHSLHGDVSLEELRGAVDVSARDGDVKVTALRGPVHLQTQDDNATITAHSLGSGLTVDGRTGDIDLSDIDGAVTLHGDFFGTTHMERVRGAVHFQSSFTDLQCAGVPGDMDVEGRSNLIAHQITGPLTLSTTNRDITLSDVQGATTIKDRNGSISLGLAGTLAPVSVANENGSVEVSVPEGQGFAIHANTQNGAIENDFGMSSNKHGDSSALDAKAGHGGPLLNLQTTEGDLNLRKSSPITMRKDRDDAAVVAEPVPLRSHA